jgi:serine/threonine protein kinase/predicted ATPase
VTQPSTIAHYLVERELGRGAMGVVYLAHDTKLGRPVAIKALPADLSRDEARRARFEREARTLAAVNHPNIAAIYGLEEAEGLSYLILELVEGPTLTRSLEECGSTGLPLHDALSIALQIASGVHAAHERGIIHRDLKPDNIKIRPDGVVKVLDFGIARADAIEETVDAGASTIMSLPKAATTQAGAILGTPGYMSPEQARGQPVSRATDLWAFGCMLFECLTGRVAFPGTTVADALASTLLGEPAWSTLPEATPPRVLTLLQRCLEKDARKRVGDLSQARVELQQALAELSTGVAHSAGPGTEPTRSLAPSNLPPSPAIFQGRKRELADAAQSLRALRVVTLAGVPGMGRSTLALRLAHQVREDFENVWWVATQPLKDPGAGARAVATALGVRSKGEALSRAVERGIAARRVLLVLGPVDEAPTVSAEVVSALLAACPNVRVIAFGEHPLGIRSESVVAVGPLSAPDPTQPRGPDQPLDAGDLLLRRVSQVLKSPVADPTTAMSIATAAYLARGIPLAMELLAPTFGTMSAAQVVERLEQRLTLAGLAASAPADRPALERTLLTIIDWAYDQLSHVERGLLQRLAVFAGPFTALAAGAVAGADDCMPSPAGGTAFGGPISKTESKVAEMLSNLQSRGLLSKAPSWAGFGSRDRFILHPTIRRLALERLTQRGGFDAVHQQHARYITALLEQAVPRLGRADGDAWSSRLLAEDADISAALERLPSATLADLVSQYRGSVT